MNHVEEVKRVLETQGDEIVEFAGIVAEDMADRQWSDETNRVFVAGNGGSSSIVSHAVCDLMKRAGTLPVTCLSDNVPMVTAIANDEGYEFVFSRQLEMQGVGPGDLLVLVSSSGDSENVVAAATYAKRRGAKVLSMVGFEGGRLLHVSDECLHVKSSVYEVVEDVHSIAMHSVVREILYAQARVSDEKAGQA